MDPHQQSKITPAHLERKAVVYLRPSSQRQVLGIKATLSVVELKVLRLRLLEGMREKARRGELARVLPPGYVRDKTGKVVKDPDGRVQDAIALMFRKFREARSDRQAWLWFRDQGVELPVNKPTADGMKITWQVPNSTFVGHVLLWQRILRCPTSSASCSSRSRDP